MVKAAVLAVAGESSFRPLPRLFPQLKSRGFFARPFFPNVVARVDGFVAAALDPPVSIVEGPAGLPVFDPLIANLSRGETVTWTNRMPGSRTIFVFRSLADAQAGRVYASSPIITTGQTWSLSFGGSSTSVDTYHIAISGPFGITPILGTTGTLVVSPVPVSGPGPGALGALPQAPGPRPQAQAGSIEARENWAAVRYGGVVRADGIIAHVADDHRINLQAIGTIPYVNSVEYYANARKIIVTCNPAYKAEVMSVLDRLPGIWFSEDDYGIVLRGCADNQPCRGGASQPQWITACKVPQAWCESIEHGNRIYFFDSGGEARADCGTQDLIVIPTDAAPNNPSHANRVVPYAVNTGFCLKGAATYPPTEGRLYYGESAPGRYGTAFLTAAGRVHCEVNVKDEFYAQRLSILPGDVFNDYGVMDSAWVWAHKGLVVGGVNYAEDGRPLGAYQYLAASFGQADGGRRSVCAGGFGMLCVLPQLQGQDYVCAPCAPAGNYCNSSAAGPALAGLLSLDRQGIGWSSGMRRANALARSCSRYPTYSEESGFGVPDACKYMEQLAELSSRNFHSDVEVAERNLQDLPGGTWSRLTVDLGFLPEDGAPFETHGLSRHVRDFEIRVQVAAPQGDVNKAVRLNDTVVTIDGFQIWLDLLTPPWRRGTSWQEFQGYRRRYVAGGRIGFNSFYGVREYVPADSKSYDDPVGANFWPWRHAP